uniref:Uncharacterized protein n=1 Tax=Anguilla anguilla TaxID=7936 RepID=A0A0E9SLB7_ANGAN
MIYTSQCAFPFFIQTLSS